jgi:hypothetical protein
MGEAYIKAKTGVMMEAASRLQTTIRRYALKRFIS